MIRHHLLAAALCAAAMLAAAGCSSTEDTAGPDTTASTSPQPSTTTTQPVTAEFCQRLAQVGTESATSGGLPTAEQATSVAASIDELAGQAPTEEVAAALRTLGSLYTRIASVAGDQEQVIGVLFAESANQDVVRAGTTIDSFVAAQCS